MNICFVTRYFDYRNAGIGRVSLEVTKAVEALGHHSHKISTNGDSLYSYLFYTLFELQKRIPRNGFDVYHALTPMEGMWTPKDKTVVTFLDLIPVLYPERSGAGIGYSKWKRFVGSTYFRYGCKKATNNRILVCISEQVKEDVMNCFGVEENRIRVIRLGIDDRLEPQVKPDKTFRIGYLGQLDKRKRVDLLINEFRKTEIDGQLVIAGTGRDESLLRVLAGSDKRIKFVGFIPDKKLVDFYGLLDLFVLPSMAEGYGLCPVEAMACKKPVIVMEDSIIPNDVKDRCIQTSDLAGLLDRIYKRRKQSSLDWQPALEDNYAFAKTHSWKKCAEEYVKCYEEIAQDR